MNRQTLLIDADDTLWENNIFFERIIDGYLSRLETLGHARDYIRHILNETERRNVRQHGYGVRCFARSLTDAYLKLAGSLSSPQMIEEIGEMAKTLESTPPRILEGVPETLAYLCRRHRLILFTKGEAAEQAAKVERSGLQEYFEHIEITAEKDLGSYSHVINRFKIVKTRGWMIGNSPRSDINPALDAGLNAVFIPHTATWQLEQEELRSGIGRLVVLSSFCELRQHF